MLPLSSFGSRWGRVLLVVLLLAATLGTARAQAVLPGQGLVADTTELRVLRELYAATGGPQWTRHGHWPATPAAWQAATLDSAKTWYGVDVDAGDVFRLNLGGNHLQGELPAGLGRLAALRELYLGSNQLGGALPASLGRMRQLGALIVNANQLSGPLPDSLGRCTALYVLYLNQNQLSGALPTWLGRLTALQQLGLDHNQFSGHLPATLANCQYLWMLNLADNQLDGPIPGTWGRLRSSQIFLSRNRLSGALPDSLALITNLEYLDAENNRFTGPIPAAYKRFKRLNRLNLADNQLTGSIPDSLKAAFLLLLNNHLSGELPASYGTTHNWQILLDGNNITRIPRFLQPLGYPNLQLGLTNNYLQFDSYEPNQVIPGQWQFWDYGQRPPAPADTLERVAGTAAALNGAIGGDHNRYQWQRQEAGGAWADLPSQTQPTLKWAAIALSDAGLYRARVTNDWVPQVTLYSRTLPVRVNKALTTLPPSNPSDDLNRNWAIERSFDGDGNVIAESKHFSDGLGRPTQRQARNVANGNVFAAQTIYSSGGQAVLHTLAAPINNQAFRYQEHFVTATMVPAGGNTPISRDYGPDNFEGAKASNPDPLDESTAGTLGNYYSEQNLLEPLTPAAHNPYSLVESYEGPWGGMKRGAAPGDNFRMGLGHEVRSREIPVRKEFDPYLSLRPQFVPGSPLNTLEYQGTKTVSIDADGREAIVVSNKDGQTLVTCLSGPQYPTVNIFGFISAGPNTSDDANAPAFQDVHIPAAGPVEVTFTVGDWVRVKNLQTGDSSDYEITPRGPSPGIRVTLQPGFYRFISLGGTQWFSYQAHYGNFSYTYYDDAGRVVATVAPNGLAQETTTPTGNPTAGLVGTWGFNEGSGTVAGDGSGNALTGALVNQPEWNSPARTWAIPPSPGGGDYLVFNGTNYVRVGDTPTLRMSGTVSFEAWIYPTSNRSSIILNKENEYEMARFSDGSIRWAFYNATPGWAWVPTGITVPLKTWSHVAITYDNGVVTAYLNGTQTGQVFAGTGTIVPHGGEFWIGGRQGNGERFYGAIDKVRVYNTVHPPSAGSGAFVDLVGEWDFDEGSGTVAGDASFNWNAGTLVNAPAWGNSVVPASIPPSPAGGSCLVFNGISYVRVGNPPALRLNTMMSMEAWIYPTANQDGIILNKENEYEMQRFADGSIQCAFQNARPGWAWINTGVVAPLNTWSHIAITYDNGVVTTYLNGQPAGAVFQGAGAISAASGGEFWIGGRSCCGYYFPGAIDEVHVWNTVHAPNGLVAANNAPGVNLVKNPSFDLEVRTAQTGAYWNTARDWQSEGDVQDVFTEDYGVAHSGVMHETHYSQSGSPYHVITHQLISNLPSGSYNLRAWVKGSGGQPVARMFARNFGGGEVGATILPTPSGPSGAWALLEVNGIQVTTGQCDIAFESTANRGGQFIYFDDVVFEPVTDNAHSQYVTRNTYNSLSNLLSTETTDAGRTEYVYARDGRIRFSQNALQRPVGRYSYSNYDELGRVVESGEYTPGQYAVNVFENHLTAIPASNSVLQTSILESRSRTGGLYPNWCAQRQQSWYDLPWDGSNGSQGNDSQLNGRKQEFILASVAKTSNDKVTTWYSYDEIGRVTWVVKDIIGIGIKTLDYKYDFNGNVLEVAYQNGQPDAFHHYYEYDAAKRLYKVYTSSDGVARILQAKYTYYLHGPLKRVELANRLQGLDYAYTLQGWLKSINHVNERLDMGADSPAANGVPKDLFALTLDYFSGDYRSRSLNVMTPTGLTSATNPYRYDGTIRASSWRTAASPDHQQMVYAYDEKSQLKQSAYGKLGISGAYYHFDVAANKAFEEGGLDYDQNGNIQSLRRTDQAGTVTDNFTYKYAANTNKLTEVHSGGATGPTVLDYDYDALGQMTRQRDEQGQRYLTYDISGKTTGVYLDAAHQQPVVEFTYDDRGFRVSKKSYGRGTSAGQVRTTYYVRDMAGNVLSVYEQGPQTGNVVQRSEVPLYGSRRVGTLTRLDDGSEDYRYELTDNRGDSRVVFHKPTTETLTETMELSGVSSRAAFQNDNLYRAALSGTPSGIYVAQFSDTQAPGTELKRTLTVEKSDTITFSALGLFQDQAAGLSGARVQPYLMLGAAATSDEIPQRGLDAQPSVAHSNSVKWLGRIAAGLSLPIGQHIKRQYAVAYRQSTTTLQGWIKYRVLNAQGTEVSTHTEYLIGTGAWESVRLGVRVQQAGLVEVIAGSTGQGSVVYFDNLTVEQTGGMIVQEQHQSAYGSPLVGLNYAIGNKAYRHGYQGQFAEKDNETGWDSFELRTYNSRIGRWMTYDPYGQFSSPYVGMGNEPVAGIDPDGGWKPKLPKFRQAQSAVQTAARNARTTAKVGRVVGLVNSGVRAAHSASLAPGIPLVVGVAGQSTSTAVPLIGIGVAAAGIGWQMGPAVSRNFQSFVNTTTELLEYLGVSRAVLEGPVAGGAVLNMAKGQVDRLKGGPQNSRDKGMKGKPDAFRKWAHQQNEIVDKLEDLTVDEVNDLQAEWEAAGKPNLKERWKSK